MVKQIDDVERLCEMGIPFACFGGDEESATNKLTETELTLWALYTDDGGTDISINIGNADSTSIVLHIDRLKARILAHAILDVTAS